VGDPDVPDHISLWELILPMRQVFQQYVNVRPSSILPGIPSRVAGSAPGDLDWVIIRENTEGEYAGQGGRTHVGTEHEVATELAVFTRKGVERVMRYAFETAQKRPKKFLTVVSKSNAQVRSLLGRDDKKRSYSSATDCCFGTRSRDWCLKTTRMSSGTRCW
jgi:tartrate dehydrogenase/decarboxylase/D-malate dehydrogenase